jgi:transposase
MPEQTDDIEVLRAALAAEREARLAAEARAVGAEARATGAEAMIAHLKLVIAKLRHDRFGASERGRKLLDQLELELGELVATVAEDTTRAEGQGGERPGAPPPRKPIRGTLPAHLPRERVVVPSPSACPCCGGRLSKLGEDVTETLEVVPRSWKVIQTVRERFSCRACEAITQPPAPFHPIARGRAGPNLLAMILEAKFGQHLPLNRQSVTYGREGVELSVSTLADWVGTAAAVLSPLHALIRAHVLAAERLHGDDTTVPLLARGQDGHGPALDLCAGRPALCRASPTGRPVPLLPRSHGRAPQAPPGLLLRDPAGRRLCRVRRALPARPQARADYRGRLLGALPAESLRAGRDRPGATRGRGHAAHRPGVRG